MFVLMVDRVFVLLNAGRFDFSALFKALPTVSENTVLAIVQAETAGKRADADAEAQRTQQMQIHSATRNTTQGMGRQRLLRFVV